LYNPISGTGHGATLAEQLAEQLRQTTLEDGRPLTVAVAATCLDSTESWLDPLLEEVELLVVLGGDGAVRLAAPAAIRAGVALAQYPAGTENLFARDFGMRPDACSLVDSINCGRIEPIDVGWVNGELMLLCASVGLDAAIAHDVARHRSGGISHLSYVRPLIRQLLRWRREPTQVEIVVDGEALGSPETGFVLIANSPQYALRMNPARDANNEDGLLDVVFMPAKSSTALVAWALRSRRGTHMSHPGLKHARGKEIRLLVSPPGFMQVDGDPAGGTGRVAELVATIQPRALQVLRLPSENGGC
jgi:diacylglycerol kinase (ATP)